MRPVLEVATRYSHGVQQTHDRSGQPDMVMGQSIVLSEIKTEVPLENGDPAYQNFLLQRYEERIKSLVENTLFQEVTDHHNPKGWIQGNTKIGLVLDVTTSCLYGKHGVEIRIWSLSEDNTQSWVIISHGSNKFVIGSNNNDTEIPEDLPEEQALQLKVKDFAMPIKGKSKTAKKRTC